MSAQMFINCLFIVPLSASSCRDGLKAIPDLNAPNNAIIYKPPPPKNVAIEVWD